MKAYQAYSSRGQVTAETPCDAAAAFFDKFPTARKCDIVEGEKDGAFFTVAYGRISPKSWKDVTKKTAATLTN